MLLIKLTGSTACTSALDDKNNFKMPISSLQALICSRVQPGYNNKHMTYVSVTHMYIIQFIGTASYIQGRSHEIQIPHVA